MLLRAVGRSQARRCEGRVGEWQQRGGAVLEGRGAHQLLAVEERGRKKGLEGNREREGCWELFLPLLAMLLLLAVTRPH